MPMSHDGIVAGVRLTVDAVNVQQLLHRISPKRLAWRIAIPELKVVQIHT
jgi:hypothetical protein